ncbi:hypothetical protein DFR76_102841 [Nocardia pseudobrasiliensis]|uniref:Uncharacterized protein n=1 Tax=Nocardia pseudobrasiliensis TaxID=45979 RepID=A0A370ICV0_9NOCA|nr:hypothetical protein DFR76_102841 [Nocardia pseudobrasiliensis]
MTRQWSATEWSAAGKRTRRVGNHHGDNRSHGTLI